MKHKIRKIPPFDKLRANEWLSRKLNLTKYMNCNRAKKPPFILSLSKEADETQNQKNPTPFDKLRANGWLSGKLKIVVSRVMIVVLTITAIWNLGQGSYILAKAELAQWLIASAWQQTTTERTQIKPWPWADTWPVARLEMPQHNIDQYVLAGTSGASLAFGPGYMFSSAAPTQQGNTVIAAHRDTHFAFLEHVKVGETISVTNTEGEVREYAIQDMKIVDKNDVDWINAENNPYQLTLVTCYPFDAITAGGRLRYVVRAIS